MTVDLRIVGAGPMARAHAAAASHLGCGVRAVSRSDASASSFTAATGLPCDAGGLAAMPEGAKLPPCAIIAVDVEGLLEASLLLLRRGVKRLLVEKPAGLDAGEVATLDAAAAAAGAAVFVAYNRRFYASVRRAAEMVAEDGGATSVRFDFTERSDLVATGKQSAAVKRNWFLANSSHVVDLAFHLAGWPETLSARVEGALPWHPACGRFVGAGRTTAGAAFSYHADWEAPGRWSVDLRTRRRRLLLEPLEELRVQAIGSFAVTPVDLPAEPAGLKPGVLAQLAAFLAAEATAPLVSIAAHARHVRDVYTPMLTGDPGSAGASA
jgi:predicted dehydrogenase